MLKALNRVWLRARSQAAAWRRWHRKLPHNRVRRQHLRDAQGRLIGYGPPEPLPEPPLHPGFCRKAELPSGRIELALTGAIIEEAYRLARHPKATGEEVKPFPINFEEIGRLYQLYCLT
jgi:hypothetical protein